MSYQKYVNYKENIKVETNLDNYEEHLKKLVEKSIGSKLKDVLCKQEVYSLSKELYYPRSEILKLAIFSEDVQKVNKELKTLKEWSIEFTDKDSNELISLVEAIKSGFYIEVSQEDVDMAVSSYKKHYSKKLSSLAGVIESVIKEIKWKNNSILIEPIILENNFEINEVLLVINKQRSAVLDLDASKGRTIQESIYFKEANSLIEAIKKFNPNKNKIVSFYLEGSKKNKKLVETIIKESSLGLKIYLPEGTKLTKERKEGWHVKIDEKNILKTENDNEYIVGSKEAQIKFIEKL